MFRQNITVVANNKIEEKLEALLCGLHILLFRTLRFGIERLLPSKNIISE